HRPWPRTAARRGGSGARPSASASSAPASSCRRSSSCAPLSSALRAVRTYAPFHAVPALAAFPPLIPLPPFDQLAVEHLHGAIDDRLETIRFRGALLGRLGNARRAFQPKRAAEHAG